MKIMSKKSIACAAAFFLAFASFALETGGLITDNTDFKNAEKDGSLKLDQTNGLNLWLRAPLSEDGSSYFAGEGSFKFEYDDSIADSDKKTQLYADLELFKFVLKRELDSGDFTLSLGRFFNSDLTSLVYAQNGDGLKLDASVSAVNLSVFAAYTGLLNAKNITIIGDTADLTDKEKTVYVLADKFAAGSLTLSLPYVVASQTISLEGIGAFSLESTKYNRFYGTLAVNGPIVSPVFYNLSSTFGFAKYDEEDMTKGNLTKGSISVYPDYKSLSISLNALYASGEQGSFDAFKGFTSGTSVSSLLEPEYSGVLTAGLSATIKPLPSLLAYASGDIVFDAEKDIKQAGFQYNAGISWQALSDLSFGLSFGQYIGKDDYAATIGENKTQLKLNAAIAF